MQQLVHRSHGFVRGPGPASTSCRRAVRPTWHTMRATADITRPVMPQVEDPWQKAQDMLFSGAIEEGVIRSVNKGGVIVQMGELRGFMPYNKLAADRLRPGHKGDLSYLLGQKVKARVVQVDLEGPRKELVLSERQARLTEAIQALQLQPDSIVKGTVTRLEDYGVFVALAGKDGQPSGVQGLIQKSELSWDRVMTVDEVVHTGQEVEAKVLDVDLGRCRVSLSLRQTQADPLRQTIDSLSWSDSSEEDVLPEVARIVAVLQRESGITSVQIGRRAEEHSIVAQDLELYLTKEETAGGFTLVARAGKVLQELRVSTSISRDAMKKALTRVLSRVRS